MISEYTIQIACVKWFRIIFPDILIFHIPNGGKRDAREARSFKSLGVVAGIPDLFIPEFKLFIEVKNASGRLSFLQRQIHKVLGQAGYKIDTISNLNMFKDSIRRFKDFDQITEFEKLTTPK